MPSDHPNPAGSAAARQARAEHAAAMRTAMNVGRKQMGKAPPQDASASQWVTAIVVVAVVIGMLIAVIKLGH